MGVANALNTAQRLQTDVWSVGFVGLNTAQRLRADVRPEGFVGLKTDLQKTAQSAQPAKTSPDDVGRSLGRHGRCKRPEYRAAPADRCAA